MKLSQEQVNSLLNPNKTDLIYHYNSLKCLLEMGADPSIYKNYPLIVAISSGQTEIVKLLLKDKRVNPADNHQDSIKRACSSGFHNIVRELLKDKRVNPAINNNKPIRDAFKYNHTEVIKVLLKDKRVNPNLAGHS